MKDNIHEGHRKRVKDEFLSGNYTLNTPEHKWLELLLFYCIHQSDTNPLAHELLNKYKTLTGVFEAPIEELVKFKGLTQNNAILLKMIIPLARMCETERSNELFKSLNPDNINDYILSKFYGLSTEQVGIVCINPIGKILDFKFLAEGDISEVSLSARTIIKYILDNNASCIVVAHNHPNSFALPSKADINATKRLIDLLKPVNVRVLDHIIVSGNDYVSLAQSVDYKHIFI